MSNTYEFPGKEDVRITVGDEKQQDFFPRMKIKRWDNEVNFSVGIISTFQGSHDKVGDKVEWNDGHGIGARFYEKPDDQFEFEIVLDEKPASGFVLLSIKTKGLDFLYQPPLTQEEKDAVVIDEKGIKHPQYVRPDNVVGSYAVYHESMKGNYLDGKNYRAGKAFHIYRPFVTDANGKQVWCDMDITGSVMKITIPDGLVYPVIVDPTFGVDPASHGSSSRNVTNNDMYGSLFTSPSDAINAENIIAYMRTVGAAVAGMKGIVVLHSNLNIITDGVGDQVMMDNSYAWKTSDLSPDPSISGNTEYVLMVVTESDEYVAYDAGVANQSHYDNSNNYGTPTNPTDASHSSDLASIYCTYTAAPSAPSTGMQPPPIALFGGI